MEKPNYILYGIDTETNQKFYHIFHSEVELLEYSVKHYSDDRYEYNWGELGDSKANAELSDLKKRIKKVVEVLGSSFLES